MDPDDVFSASFDVSSEDLEYGNYTLGFKVSFKQDNEYYETPIVTSTISIITQTNKASEGSFLFILGAIIIVILLILIFGFYFNKRRTTK
jgi:hypothetical protein